VISFQAGNSGISRFTSGCIQSPDSGSVEPFFTYFPDKMLPRVGHSVLRQARTQLKQKASPTPVASLSALARLLSSLAVLEQKDGKLNHGSLGAVTAAQKLGGSIIGFVAGGNIKAVAEEAAKVKGFEKILAVDNAAYDKVLSLIVLLGLQY